MKRFLMTTGQWTAVLLGAALTVAACSGDKKTFADPDGTAGGGTGGGSGKGGKGGSAGSPSGATGGDSGSTSGGKGGSTGGSTGGTVTDAGEGGMGTVDPPETCTGDADCTPAGMVCDPVPAECVECLFDTDCQSDERCVDRVCGPVTACVNSLDCADTDETVCDESVGQCVECLTASDCDANNDCTDNRCVPYDQRRNSLDCSNRRVCDTARQRCVECARDADCGTGRRCVDYSCREGCASDNECTDLGMLCHLNGGYCVECLDNLDCPSVYYCNAGSCEVDVCPAGTSQCLDNAVATCRVEGDGYDTVSCLARQTCLEDGLTARCEPWACTAGVTECDLTNSSLVTCSDDGLEILDEEDCSANGEICYMGSCQDLACPPSQSFCEGETIRVCASDGLSSTLTQTCGSGQFCDDATVTCLTQVCTPNQPWCNGALAQVCNARGSGSTGAGTNCAAIGGHECVAGECVCQSNRLDCDDDEGNGCEINGSTDADNCGGCDAACSNNHMQTRTCSASNCNGTCAAGYTDCNSDKREDGCETHTDTNVTHCGACNRACSSSNMAGVSCAGGICNGTCASGYADCNANKQTDGCETETLSNANACGGCSNNCSSNHMQTRTCSAGSCNGTCAAGFDDCNDDKLTDGCEADVRYDEQNCGACGDPCADGESCVNGTCQVCNDTVLLIGNPSTPTNAAVETLLENSGLVVTRLDSAIYTYAGSPPAGDFGAVVVLVTQEYSQSMNVTGQESILAAQQAGTGVVFTEGFAYTRSLGYNATLDPLALFTYTSSNTVVITYTLTSAGHPIWDGLPTTWSSISGMGVSYGTLKSGATSIASCTGCSTAGGVMVKDDSGGRIVNLAHWSNYTPAWPSDTYGGPMFVNAVKWATGCF